MRLQPDDYLEGVLRTANLRLPLPHQLENCIISIQGEWGEVANYCKKVSFHGKDFVTEKLLDEMGDVLFYLFWLCKATNQDFSGYSFSDYFLADFDRFWQESSLKDLNKIETAHSVLQSIVVLSARIDMFYKCWTEGKALSSVWAENIEQSCKDILKALGIFALAYNTNCSWAYIAQLNQNKLRMRYPDGFSTEASENRSI